MKDIYIDDIPSGTPLQADICIIGGGAAGITIAKSLKNTNLSIAILESGTHIYNNETQKLYDVENIGTPLRIQQGYISRNRYLGGSTNTWHGRCAPLDEIDFKKREWIPNSGWPITRTELNPYYQKAASILQLPESTFFDNDTWQKYVLKRPDHFLKDSMLSPSIYLYGKQHLNMRQAYAKELSDSKNIQIYLNANVTEIKSDKSESTIESINIATLLGNKYTFKAKHYVLATGGMEAARLLLASNKVNSVGLGNYYDNVGRYYTEHPKILGSKLIPLSETLRSPIMFWKRKVSRQGYLRLCFKLSEEQQKLHEISNCYVELTYPQSMTESLQRLSELKLSKSFMHQLIRFSPHVFDIIGAFERIKFNLPLKFNYVKLNSHIEQIPDRESRLTLGDEVDALGMPRLKVNWKVSTTDKNNLRRFHHIFGEIIKTQNLGRLESDLPESNESWTDLTDSSHHMGATRMSDNPKLGVVDENLYVHGIDNLFIVGASVFPTGGHVNPTFTVVALAARLAEHLKRERNHELHTLRTTTSNNPIETTR